MSKWIPIKEEPYPKNPNGWPFWVTVQDGRLNIRLIKFVIYKGDDKLYETDHIYGEECKNVLEEQVVSWLPLNNPLYPDKN